MRSLLPTDAWVWSLLPVAVVVIAVGIDRNYQTDLWRHLARGRLIAAEGRLINEDRFTCTVSGRPLVDATWGWQVANWELYRLGGLSLVQAVNAVTAGAAMALLILLCRRRGAAPVVAAAVGVFVFFGLWQQIVLACPDNILPAIHDPRRDPRGRYSPAFLARLRSVGAGHLGQLPWRLSGRPVRSAPTF